jgi:hypothetical protein
MAELGDATVLLQAAIDALCEPKTPVTDDERRKRWERASNRLKVWVEIGRAWQYQAPELNLIKKRLRRVRQMVHGSDSFLLNMGYPEGFERLFPPGGRAAGRRGDLPQHPPF